MAPTSVESRRNRIQTLPQNPEAGLRGSSSPALQSSLPTGCWRPTTSRPFGSRGMIPWEIGCFLPWLRLCRSLCSSAALAFFHIKAHYAALAGLVTALVIAILVFHMPDRLALTTAVYGVGYGLFPIGWIILNVIFLYRMTLDDWPVQSAAGEHDRHHPGHAFATAADRLQLRRLL